ncbi:MinD/ParA family protein [candidate division KSB1 bacterium]|nr:MinD/ParA family protein [candidate division KSB1 bacterium]
MQSSTLKWKIENGGYRIGPISSYGLALWGVQGLLYPGDVLVQDERLRVRAGVLSGLQPFIRNNGHLKRAKIWAFAGGKGGVGKSLICALSGISLAATGRRVVIVDADFGGPNQHDLLNLSARRHSYWQVLRRRPQSFASLVIPTGVPNLGLIAGPPQEAEGVQTAIMDKIRFIEALRSLDADVVLLDLGPRMEGEALDYFITADTHVLVTTPETTAIQNLSAFVRSVFKRKIDTVLRTLVRSSTELDIQECVGSAVHRAFELLQSENLPARDIVRRAVSSVNASIIYNMVRTDENRHPQKLLQKYFLSETGIDARVVGRVNFETALHSVLQKKQLLQKLPSMQPLMGQIDQIVARLNRVESIREADVSRLPSRNRSGVTDTIICGTWCPSWDACEYQTPGYPCPVRNLN